MENYFQNQICSSHREFWYGESVLSIWNWSLSRKDYSNDFMIEMIIVFRLYSIFEVCAKNESLRFKYFTIFYIFWNRSIDLTLHQKQCIGTIYHFELHFKGCTHSCINYLLTLKICSMAFLTISLAFGMLESRTGVMACRMLKL